MNQMTFYNPQKGQQELVTIDVVKRALVSGNGQPSNSDCALYLNKCKALDLNPFLGDSYLIMMGSKATMVIAKGGYLKNANRFPSYDGFDAGIIVVDQDHNLIYRPGTLVLPNEQLIGGWADVRRKDWSKPARAEVSLSEYNSGRDNWKRMPGTMIRKVALVHALREAFPDKYHGAYAAEEIDHDPPRAEVVRDEPVSFVDRMQSAKAIDVGSMVQTVDIEQMKAEAEPVKAEVVEQEDDDFQLTAPPKELSLLQRAEQICDIKTVIELYGWTEDSPLLPQLVEYLEANQDKDTIDPPPFCPTYSGEDWLLKWHMAVDPVANDAFGV